MLSWLRPKPALSRSEIESLLADWSSLARKCVDLSERLETLEDKHSRLRGVVYGRKLHKEPAAEPAEEPQERRSAPQTDTARMTREELKRHLARSGRFIPGKPAIHSE